MDERGGRGSWSSTVACGWLLSVVGWEREEMERGAKDLGECFFLENECSLPIETRI